MPIKATLRVAFMRCASHKRGVIIALQVVTWDSSKRVMQYLGDTLSTLMNVLGVLFILLKYL